MKIEIDLKKCNHHKIRPDEYVLLYLMYHKEYDKIEKLFGRKKAVAMKEILETFHSNFFINKDPKPFKKTILSNKEVCKLLNIREEQVNFIEFYNLYPVRVGSRVLRAANVDTVIGKKHEAKYLKRIKTKEAHEQAKKAIEAFVAKQRQSGKLQYLPNMETVLNNAAWEAWEELIDESGTEQKDWNEQSI